MISEHDRLPVHIGDGDVREAVSSRHTIDRVSIAVDRFVVDARLDEDELPVDGRRSITAGSGHEQDSDHGQHTGTRGQGDRSEQTPRPWSVGGADGVRIDHVRHATDTIPNHGGRSGDQVWWERHLVDDEDRSRLFRRTPTTPLDGDHHTVDEQLTTPDPVGLGAFDRSGEARLSETAPAAHRLGPSDVELVLGEEQVGECAVPVGTSGETRQRRSVVRPNQGDTSAHRATADRFGTDRFGTARPDR